MPINATHAMFPDANQDEQSRQHFIRSFKVHIAGEIMPGNQVLYRSRVVPKFLKEKSRQPKTRREVREALSVEPFNQMWSSLLRTSQEMLYDTVRPSIERQLPELIERAKKKYSGKLGTLQMDSSLEMPSYHTAVDIHCKPGAYHTAAGEDDILAGAEFDRTLHLYFMGNAGPNNDDMGVSSGRFLRERFPNFRPKRILDMGCTIGHSTLPYVDHFPGAEVYALDVAGPCVRYGHHRAEALGKKVHFSQQNAEHTSFPDGYFDLVVSHIMLHETSTRGSRAIFKECHRLLRKGGIMMHVDGIGRKDPFEKYFAEWNAHYNAEPYLGTVQDEDFKDISVQAGFQAKDYFETGFASSYVTNSKRGEGKGFGAYYCVGAVKS
ncbi:MAG: class I SAM-dependent methyltransferase [Alphaproteobacteria bacterium]|nr:class I SAM-dependent methyltransferase [Alphaproteobacteria bacterium]